jgi:hypothetical protein
LKEWDGEAWTRLLLMTFGVPYNVEYFLTSCGPVSFSKNFAPWSELVGWLVGWLVRCSQWATPQPFGYSQV